MVPVWRGEIVGSSGEVYNGGRSLRSVYGWSRKSAACEWHKLQQLGAFVCTRSDGGGRERGEGGRREELDIVRDRGIGQRKATSLIINLAKRIRLIAGTRKNLWQELVGCVDATSNSCIESQQ